MTSCKITIIIVSGNGFVPTKILLEDVEQHGEVIVVHQKQLFFSAWIRSTFVTIELENMSFASNVSIVYYSQHSPTEKSNTGHSNRKKISNHIVMGENKLH